MGLEKTSEDALPAVGSKEGFDYVATRNKWARDEEVRIDLSVISQNLLSVMHSGMHARLPAMGDWVRQFRKLSEMEPRELALDRRLSTSEGDRILEAFAEPSCRAMLSARRRWPMALALAGSVDLRTMGEPPKPAYDRMGRLALEWVARNHPGFALRTKEELERPGPQGIDAARLGVVQEVMSALFSFGEDVGMPDQMEALRSRAQELSKRMVWDRSLRSQRKQAPDAFFSELEAMHLAWATMRTASEPGPSDPKPSVRL